MIALGIPRFVALMERVSGQPLLDTSVYPLAYVPVDLRAVDFISISATAFVLSLLASVLPAISTSRSSITESLRQSR
jgi:lipoprotein-releasing system permease protein